MVRNELRSSDQQLFQLSNVGRKLMQKFGPANEDAAPPPPPPPPPPTSAKPPTKKLMTLADYAPTPVPARRVDEDDEGDWTPGQRQPVIIAKTNEAAEEPTKRSYAGLGKLVSNLTRNRS